ncbi:MAG: hypothetical protein WA154_10840 [Moraxellaceae bacterium]
MGRRPKELDGARPLPPAGAHLWHTFVELSNSCQGSIPYGEIEAYIRLTGNTLSPPEVEIIKLLDAARSQPEPEPTVKRRR